MRRGCCVATGRGTDGLGLSGRSACVALRLGEIFLRAGRQSGRLGGELWLRRLGGGCGGQLGFGGGIGQDRWAGRGSLR